MAEEAGQARPSAGTEENLAIPCRPDPPRPPWGLFLSLEGRYRFKGRILLGWGKEQLLPFLLGHGIYPVILVLRQVVRFLSCLEGKEK